jgi:hypothetical protein
VNRGPAPRGWVGLLFGLATAALAIGCRDTKLTECDAYVATIERLASCPDLPAEARGTLATSALTIKRALTTARSADDGTAGVGQTIGQMRATCRVGTERLRAEFGLRVPACVTAE